MLDQLRAIALNNGESIPMRILACLGSNSRLDPLLLVTVRASKAALRLSG
jgi:hypothetical protein